MIRRAVLSAVALTVLGGIAGPAIAAEAGQAASAKNYVYCVSLDNSHNGSRDGVCVWIPTS